MPRCLLCLRKVPHAGSARRRGGHGLPHVAADAGRGAYFRGSDTGQNVHGFCEPLSGLFLQPEWLWPHAMPIDISLGIQDGAKMFSERSADLSAARSTNYRLPTTRGHLLPYDVRQWGGDNGSQDLEGSNGGFAVHLLRNLVLAPRSSPGRIFG